MISVDALLALCCLEVVECLAFANLNFIRVAGKNDLAIAQRPTHMFRLRTEVLNHIPQSPSRDCPAILRALLVEGSVEHFSRLICQPVCFHDTRTAVQFDNKAAFWLFC